MIMIIMIINDCYNDNDTNDYYSFFAKATLLVAYRHALGSPRDQHASSRQLAGAKAIVAPHLRP